MRRSVLLALAVPALVAGCGSSSTPSVTRTVPANTIPLTDSTPATAPPATTVTVPGSSGQPPVGAIARANRICADRNTAVNALPAMSPTTFKSNVARITTLNAQFLARVRRVIPPGRGRDVYATFFDSLQRAAATGLQISTALGSGNFAQARALVGPELATSQALLVQGTKLGIPECGKAAATISGSGRV